MSPWNCSAVHDGKLHTKTADVVSRQHLRSASQRKMIVPRYRMDSYGRRCFAVAGPSTCQSLPVFVSLSLSIFKRHMKTHFFCEILTIRTYYSALDFIMRMSYINVIYVLGFTYLLTFVLKNHRTACKKPIIASWCQSDTMWLESCCVYSFPWYSTVGWRLGACYTYFLMRCRASISFSMFRLISI